MFLTSQVGLLPRGMHSEAPLAYDMYKNQKPEDAPLVRQYRKTFGISKTVDIEFMGVFDTVSSLWYTSTVGEHTASDNAEQLVPLSGRC
jgi:uncharacterized protein (DUF2235 family)